MPSDLRAFPQGSTLPGATPTERVTESVTGGGGRRRCRASEPGGRSRHDPTVLHRPGLRPAEAVNHRWKNEIRRMADVIGAGHEVLRRGV